MPPPRFTGLLYPRYTFDSLPPLAAARITDELPVDAGQAIITLIFGDALRSHVRQASHRSRALRSPYRGPRQDSIYVTAARLMESRFAQQLEGFASPSSTSPCYYARRLLLICSTKCFARRCRKIL